ncbi:PHP domain-containing protein [Desmospora activa]|uniref:Polymerase/histidinol phosphatase N-terminal domain-containing protein n=1 Tax=Desmospora activa DSM 45169 TaxID=1121389 RepID=A0A2T4ZBN3_9BACL|nr:PHP domain-containing protein [Desmospora activa]PTM59311.1 hypothetical protein C8J48_1923 [Desmospora activa DSM 45169]
MEHWDLHVHTTASDGMQSPEDVVRLAREIGLAGIAITDHDTVEGVKRGQKEGERLGVKVIAGVEISTLADGRDIHVLGYGMEIEDRHFLARLQQQRESRKQRNTQIIQRLHKLGIDIRMEEVAAKKRDRSPDANIGRPHIAEVLVEKGVAGSMDEAFSRWVGEDGAAYVAISRITPEEAIQLIQQAGGVPVLAHPGSYKNDGLVDRLAKRGLVGIEVRHPDHNEQMERRYRQLASNHGLIPTAGSDFHGERQGSMYHAPLGTCYVDETIVKKIQTWKKG